MARSMDYKAAGRLLEQEFDHAEDDFRANSPIVQPESVVADTERLFSSDTQAYREALVGCAVARVLDPEIDVTLPAMEHGGNSFSGRTLADNVITPFFRAKAVPVSKSPYLSSLRGGARFVAGGEPRIQRDKEGFAALVSVVDFLRELPADEARGYLRFLLWRFIQLREAANISLKQFAKPNLEQLAALIDGLASVKSGGSFPAYLATAMFQTLGECHGLGWEVEFQGINVADKFTGAVGDITVRKGGQIILGIEVTERPIGKGRVTATFDEKVSPTGLADYLFVTTARPDDEARAAAKSYTAVGHEMNFVELRSWLFDNLATIGPQCRALFLQKMLDLVQGEGSSADLKVAWNAKMDAAIGVAG